LNPASDGDAVVAGFLQPDNSTAREEPGSMAEVGNPFPFFGQALELDVVIASESLFGEPHGERCSA